MRSVLVTENLGKNLSTLNIDVMVGSTLVIVPPTVDVQWYIDNPAPNPDNEAIWAVLATPQRRPATNDQIRDALGELRALKATLKRQIRLAHQGATTSRILRDNLPFTTAQNAQQLEQIDAIETTLRKTRNNLPRYHMTFNRRSI